MDANYIILCVGLTVVTSVYFAALWHFNRALVCSVNEGQMNRRAIQVMCFMYCSISLASIIAIFYNQDMKAIYLVITIVVYIFTYLVACVIFWLTIGFESDFQLKTQTCNKDDVQIYGVNENGTEIFRFKLGKSKAEEKPVPLAKKSTRTNSI